MSVKTKIYVPPVVEGKPIVKLVEAYRGIASSDGTMFTHEIPNDFALTTFEFIDVPEGAAFALSPHPIRRVGDWAHVYAKDLAQVMAPFGKKVAVFIAGDLAFNQKIVDPELVVLIGSQYKSNLGAQEIVVPPFAEDPYVDDVHVEPLPYTDKPRVGFCGWASFPSLKAHAIAYCRKMGWYAASVITGKTYLRARQRGLFYRIAGLAALRNEPRVQTSFVIRSSFSANSNTVSNDPEVLRREFVENMTTSHFAFAPKGDGNYSVRFYEALAYGRIPVLIDTDIALPLEHCIPYEQFIVRVPHTQLTKVGDYIVRAYESFGREGIVDAQKQARNIYRSMLRYDAFFNELFSRPLEETLEASRAFYARRNNTIE